MRNERASYNDSGYLDYGGGRGGQRDMFDGRRDDRGYNGYFDERRDDRRFDSRDDYYDGGRDGRRFDDRGGYRDGDYYDGYDRPSRSGWDTLRNIFKI